MMMTCPMPTCPCPPMTTGVGTTPMRTRQNTNQLKDIPSINADTIEEPRQQREMKRLAYNGNVEVLTQESSTGHNTRSTTKGTTMAHKGVKPLVINPTTWEEAYGQTLGLCFTQYPMHKGLRIFGDKGIEAVRQEMQQFDDSDVGVPLDPNDLSMEQRERVLKYLMYLKEKRDRKIKGRGCDDGRPQRLWTDKHESSSPTAALESLMISSTIDAAERRDIATIDIPGAFLQTDQDENEEIHVKLEAQWQRCCPKLTQKNINHI
jgi:hypothetical protein